MRKPKCFGTKQYSPVSTICNHCPMTKECGEEFYKKHGEHTFKTRHIKRWMRNQDESNNNNESSN